MLEEPNYRLAVEELSPRFYPDIVAWEIDLNAPETYLVRKLRAGPPTLECTTNTPAVPGGNHGETCLPVPDENSIVAVRSETLVGPEKVARRNCDGTGSHCSEWKTVSTEIAGLILSGPGWVRPLLPLYAVKSGRLALSESSFQLLRYTGAVNPVRAGLEATGAREEDLGPEELTLLGYYDENPARIEVWVSPTAPRIERIKMVFPSGGTPETETTAVIEFSAFGQISLPENDIF